MAVSVSTAFPRTVAKTSSSPSLTDSKFGPSRSVHFTSDFGFFAAPSPCLKSQSRRRVVKVEAKKQTFSSFDELLEKSDKPVLVDFFATWCGPCQFMVPILEQVSASMRDKIKVVKIDTEKNVSVANKYKIEALPTFILFKDGEPCDRFEGAMNADQLIQRIEASLQVEQ